MADDKTDKQDDKALATKKQADAAVKESAENKAMAEQQDRIKELEAKLAEAEAREKATDKLEAAAKKVTKVADANSGDGDTIQCLLRRKGGTKVTFGHNRATQKTYHFKPIDESDDQSPHICNVDDEDHADRLLSIRESYRLYRGDSGYVDKIEVTRGANTDEGAFINKFDDILSIDFETAENDTVADWAKEVLNLTPAHSAKIREKAASLNVKPAKGDNMNEILRKIGQAMQEEERAASEQASKGK
ncbi:hypothetical protein [Psychrobacter sp.]|uniref:hypothetical protein n=1 Tax=Psychrobacter sp. TaxID=56811 RepID=UPI002FDA7DB3